MIKDNEINSYVIADYFLTKSNLTPKKIQKLVYYAYAWFIALNNENENEIYNILFDEVPEAWLHGPVFPSLYAKFKSYNWHEVPMIKKSITFENKDLMSFLDEVWDVFGSSSADELEYMTHQEDPWINARKIYESQNNYHQKISLKDIFRFYNEL